MDITFSFLYSTLLSYWANKCFSSLWNSNKYIKFKKIIKMAFQPGSRGGRGGMFAIKCFFFFFVLILLLSCVFESGNDLIKKVWWEGCWRSQMGPVVFCARYKERIRSGVLHVILSLLHFLCFTFRPLFNELLWTTEPLSGKEQRNVSYSKNLGIYWAFLYALYVWPFFSFFSLFSFSFDIISFSFQPQLSDVVSKQTKLLTANNTNRL